MALHAFEPDRASLHGAFSRELPPALTIDSGDTVRFRTLDAGWGLEPHSPAGGPRRKIEPRAKPRDDGHALCGPVAIRGAQPGMTLEIQIGAIRPGAWGWSVAGGWSSDLNQRLGVDGGGETLLTWDMDADHMVGRNQHGQSIALRPFMGVIGMPPDDPGWHPSWPPRLTGGNLDCKELVTGSTLYLPIAVPGGLVSVGDGHAAQGDGEVSSTGIECPMEFVDLTFTLREDMPLTTPRAHTPVGWLTFGLHADLNEAMALAVEAMLDLMMEQFGFSRRHALAMASLVVDIRITQVVNGVRGAHAVLPPNAIW